MSETFLGMPRPPLAEEEPLRVGNASRGGLVCRQLTLLVRRRDRFRQAWRRRWAEGEALLLSPVDAVHSFGARQGIRVHFLDMRWRVLQSLRLPRRRALQAPPHSHAALILPHDAPEQPVGDQFEVLGPQPRIPERAELGE